jgi:hypothetical protein
MGKIMIGPIQPRSGTFLPTPEPLFRMAQLSAMSGAGSGSGKRSGKADPILNDHKLMPGYKKALLRQRDQLDSGESMLQSYAMNVIEKEYHGDHKKFIAGESKKAQNGEGYFAMREELLALDNTYRTNYTSARQESEKYFQAYKTADDTKTLGDIYLDANTNSPVTKGTDADGNPRYFTNRDWMNYKAASLGINEDGLLERDVWPQTFKSGAFQKEVMDLLKTGAANEQLSQYMKSDGNLYTEKTNYNILGDPDLASNVMNLLTPEAQKDLLIQFYNYNSTQDVNKEATKGLTKQQQAIANYNLFIMDRINPGVKLLKRYSETRSSGKGTGSASGSGTTDKPMGPMLAYMSKLGNSRKRTSELTYNESGDLIHEPNNNLTEMVPIDPKLTKASDDAFYEGFINGHGVRPGTYGDYFYSSNGVPNSMKVFNGKRAAIISMGNLKENRVPTADNGLDAYGKGSIVYNLPDRKSRESAGRVFTREAIVAVHKDDLKKVMKEMKDLDMTGKVKKATLQYGVMPEPERMLDREGKETDYYTIPIELAGGDWGTFDPQSMLQNNQTNTIIANEAARKDDTNAILE